MFVVFIDTCEMGENIFLTQGAWSTCVSVCTWFAIATQQLDRVVFHPVLMHAGAALDP